VVFLRRVPGRPVDGEAVERRVSGPLSDETLLAGLAAGEPVAAAAFVRRYQARVYGLVITIVRDPGTAEDVAQDTFVRAWRNAGSYDARRGRVATWLLTIARNAAIDAMRARRPEPLDPDIVAAQLQQPGAALDEGAAPDERERVRGALAELPDPQRRALFLAAFAGRTAREIGELENAPVGTIKTRIRAAMMKLRDRLETSNEL
jgi:RNA polymerase sigma factor (sigma-70 family)